MHFVKTSRENQRGGGESQKEVSAIQALKCNRDPVREGRGPRHGGRRVRTANTRRAPPLPGGADRERATCAPSTQVTITSSSTRQGPAPRLEETPARKRAATCTDLALPVDLHLRLTVVLCAARRKTKKGSRQQQQQQQHQHQQHVADWPHHSLIIR